VDGKQGLFRLIRNRVFSDSMLEVGIGPDLLLLVGTSSNERECKEKMIFLSNKSSF